MFFEDLPSSWIEHLRSKETEQAFLAISDNVDPFRRYVPREVTLEILMKFLKPEDVLKTLQEYYKYDERSAKIIAQEIKYNVLRPISEDLLLYQIDINKIDAGAPEPKEELKPLTNTANEEPPIIFEAKEIPVSGEKREAKDTPLIIHEEKTLPNSWGAQNEKKTFASKSFSSFGFFKDKKIKETVPDQIRAKIETFVGEKMSDKDKKIVNYNEFKTPISTFEESGEFINLDTFQVVGQKKDQVSHESKIEEITKQTPPMRQSFGDLEKRPTIETPPTQASIPIQKKPTFEPTLKTPTATNSFWGNMVKEKQIERDTTTETQKTEENSVKNSTSGNTIDLRQ